MTNKKIKNYGVDFTEGANTALQLLKQKGFEVPEGTEKELNCNWELYFRAGFAAAMESIKIEQKKKTLKKSKHFDITEFIDLRRYKKCPSHHFLESVYYDAENKKAVTTNGQFMVYQNCVIPEGYENKIVDINGVFVDARFPNWKKAIPEDKDIVETDSKKFIDDVLKTDVLMNKTISAAFKSNNWYKIGDHIFSDINIKYLAAFFKSQKDCKVFVHKEDKTTESGNIYKYKNEMAIKIVGPGAVMVMMPGMTSTMSEDGKEKIINLAE